MNDFITNILIEAEELPFDKYIYVVWIIRITSKKLQ